MLYSFQPITILSLCLLTSITSLSVLLWAGWAGVAGGVTGGVVGMGVGQSAMFPGGFLWAESRLARVTPRLASAQILAGSIGAMATPQIVRSRT